VVPAESEDPVAEPVDEPVVVGVAVVVEGVAVVVEGVSVVVVGVFVVDEGVAVVEDGVVPVDDEPVVTPALPADPPPTLPVDAPSVEPVDTPELSLFPTSALLSPPALPSMDEELEPEWLLDLLLSLLLLLLSPLPLLETILVIGSVSVDVVCDCTMTGQVTAPALTPMMASCAAAARAASTSTPHTRMLSFAEEG
jgi:hypothetical protein